MVKKMNKADQDLFFLLLRSGLWEKGISLSSIDNDCWDEIFRLAEEQSIVGLVAAGMEHIQGQKVPQKFLLPFMGVVLQLEQKNRAMNAFVKELIIKLRSKDIYALLLKGQGIAQCYERPLWRSCGDIDFFFSSDNYNRAKDCLSSDALEVEKEVVLQKHVGYYVNGWLVELHGKLACGLSRKIDIEMESIFADTFYSGNVRSWDNNGALVFMLSVENDVIYVFVHFLNHFYKGGIGLRQICDWCRLLWRYREGLDLRMLELRLRRMKLMTEWKAFGALAVDWLGMPVEAMPFYSSDVCWSKKAVKIKDFIMEVGNFGHNRDNSYYTRYPFVIRKMFSVGRRCGDLIRHAAIFPLDSIRFFPNILFNGLKAAVKERKKDE